MKIGNTSDPKIVDAAPRQPTGARPAGAPAEGAKAPAAVDRVALSAASQSLAAMEAAREPVRAGKVEEVRSAIQEGRFRINPEAIADKLIKQSAELLEMMSMVEDKDAPAKG